MGRTGGPGMCCGACTRPALPLLLPPPGAAALHPALHGPGGLSQAGGVSLHISLRFPQSSLVQKSVPGTSPFRLPALSPRPSSALPSLLLGAGREHPESPSRSRLQAALRNILRPWLPGWSRPAAAVCRVSHLILLFCCCFCIFLFLRSKAVDCLS